MDTKTVDLRSDTVTRPGAAMRRAMAEAEVGDDVWGDDPTVSRLERTVAERVGKESGVFVPSGTQSNLIALLSHCGRGDEYLAPELAHTYRYEGGGAAVLGGIQPQPLPASSDGTIDLGRLRSAIKPLGDPHFARTRLLCLENTFYGKVVPLAFLRSAVELARSFGLATHLDGARLFNAEVASGDSAAHIARGFDSVSICLSKGLGAPVGSVLCGSSELIGEARRWRKVTGGGMRQAGILAAAGLVALDENVDRLATDHENARELGRGLESLAGSGIDLLRVDTNMVFLAVEEALVPKLEEALAQEQILIEAGHLLRLVTHLDVDADDVERTIRVFESFVSSRAS